MSAIAAPSPSSSLAGPSGAAPRPDVVFLSASGVMGGAERALVDMVSALRAARPAARIAVVVAADGPLAGELAARGAEPILLRWPARVAALGDAALGAGAGRLRTAITILRALPDAARYLFALRRALARLRPRVVHSNGYKMHVLGALARPRDARLIWHLHDYLRSRPVMTRALRLLARRCDLAIANSQSVAENAAPVLRGVPVRTLHNAVDIERIAGAEPLDLDAAAGGPASAPGAVRVGLVATMAFWKGHDVFLRAVAGVPEALPMHAYVVGGPVYQTSGSQRSIEELRALARDLGIADRVSFTGFVEDGARAIRALDVVVHASTEPEPFGLVIAEAMAAGRAVVASGGGGALELVEDGRTALVHPPGDVHALAECLRRLVEEPELRARLGAAASRAAAERFSPARLGEELTRAYDAFRTASRPVR